MDSQLRSQAPGSRPSEAQLLAFIELMRANHRRLPVERLRVLTDRWLCRSFPRARLRASVTVGGDGIVVALVNAG